MHIYLSLSCFVILLSEILRVEGYSWMDNLIRRMVIYKLSLVAGVTNFVILKDHQSEVAMAKLSGYP